MTAGLKVLLYGDSGTGKTTLWSTFPSPIRVFVCSGGNKPGELRSVDTAENRRRIFPIVVNSSEELCDGIESLDEERVQTVVLDHVTGLLGLVIKEHKNLPDIPAVKKYMMASQQDWGFINDKVILMLRGLLNLSCNVVVVGQEAVFKGKEEGLGSSDMVKPSIGVAVTPGIGKWLNPACDYIVQTFKRARMVPGKVMRVGGKDVQAPDERGVGVEHCLRTGPHDVYVTKFRVPKGRALPECIVDADFEKIKAVIDGKPLGK